METRRRVAITGLGAICPVGNNVQTAWDAVKQGVSGVDRITRFDPAEFSAQIAAEVKNFDPAAYFEHKEIKRYDYFSQYAVAAALEAWDQSGLDKANYERHKIGCILGVGIGGLPILEKYHQAMLEGGPRKITPFLIPAMISNLAPGNIGIRLGAKGVNYTVTSACTSSTHAIGEAARMIADGLQDVVITGGTEGAVCALGIGGFCAMKALSTRNDEPKRASRPFDKDRDGFVLGEGSAVLILESFDDAVKRGANIIGEVIGYGFSCDAYHITAPCVDGEGAVSCMRMALADAGVSTDQVGYINAHGTSTDANDITETGAIKQVFGSHANGGMLVSSTKSMTGHLLGAAGAIEAVFTVLALKEGIIPPTINLENPAEGCDLDYVPNKAREKQVEVAMSNSFGFGGTNAAVVFRRVK
jgi:3-oxoacyl-[acyl-carrier-protein] synthase II